MRSIEIHYMVLDFLGGAWRRRSADDPLSPMHPATLQFRSQRQEQKMRDEQTFATYRVTMGGVAFFMVTDFISLWVLPAEREPPRRLRRV